MRLSLLISLSSARFDFVNGVPLHRADTVSLLRCCSQPTSLYLSFQKVFLVRDKVLETLRLTASELKSDVSTNSTNPAYFGYIISHNFYFVKRKFCFPELLFLTVSSITLSRQELYSLLTSRIITHQFRFVKYYF